ncbi:SDR family NAD(P)-dependent oxidoreductase [Bacillus sp. NPDC077027]|uniref:SDR family NAD(P)-dependent oxidoreductase n=1 Tax=Bacillus sp. NPDC077027 TaxID=3390548 RepID=UPI003D042EFC
MKGKSVIVTGGAQGIGYAVTERAAKEGARVVIADNHVEFGKEAEQHLVENGHDVIFVETDISDEAAIVSMTEKTATHFGQIDMLVNCAAVFIMRGLEATVEEWRRIMDMNIMGQALCVKHTAPYMEKAGKGSIVNIASISGHIAQPKYLTYNATKAAVANMTRCMAMDLADSGIRVNAVNPGTVWNKNNERYHLEELGLTRDEANQHPEIGGMHMLKRTADPEEIASAIIFLLSDEASFITGENLMIDGGYTAM